jgi:hypothetical protein
MFLKCIAFAEIIAFPAWKKKTAKSYSMRSHSIFSPYPPSIRRSHLPARPCPLSVGGGEQAILRIGGAGQDSKQSG